MPKLKEVMIVFYDLPVTNSGDRKKSTEFRKKLIRRGFVSVQESVYAKLFHNHDGIENDIAFLEKEVPEKGEICALPVGINVFRKLRTFSDAKFNMNLFADDVIVV